MNSASVFDYPQMLCSQLWQDSLLRANFVRLMPAGLLHASDYAGVDGNREAFRLITAVAEQQLGLKVPYQLHRACDSGAVQHRVLKTVAQNFDEGRSCLHNDINDRLPQDIKSEVAKMMPKESDTVEAKQNAFSAIENFLQSKPDALGTRTVSMCAIHERLCPLSLTITAEAGSRAILSRGGSSHGSTKTYLVFWHKISLDEAQNSTECHGIWCRSVSFGH